MNTARGGRSAQQGNISGMNGYEALCELGKHRALLMLSGAAPQPEYLWSLQFCIVVSANAGEGKEAMGKLPGVTEGAFVLALALGPLQA